MQHLSLLELGCLPGFQLRTLTLPPHDAVGFADVDWADALVVVEQGELEVECCSGGRATFGEGAVLVFAGLPVLRLRNAGGAPLVLSALSRRR